MLQVHRVGTWPGSRRNEHWRPQHTPLRGWCVRGRAGKQNTFHGGGQAEEKKNQQQSDQNKGDCLPSTGRQEVRTVGRGSAGETGNPSWGDWRPSMVGQYPLSYLPALLSSLLFPLHGGSPVYPTQPPPWRGPCSSALYHPLSIPCPLSSTFHGRSPIPPARFPK